MSLRRLMFGIAVLSVSVLTMTVEANAKDQLPVQRGQRTRSKSFMLKPPLRTTSTQSRGRVPGFSMSKREFDKFIKSAVKRCGCASSAQETEYSSGCFTRCVAKYVGWSTALACVMACGGSNPGACAACIGVHEWVVLGCLQYCVWRDVFSYVEGPVSSNRGRPSTKRPGKPLMRSPGGAAAT